MALNALRRRNAKKYYVRSSRRQDEELVKEYFEEAEHQDGPEVWDDMTADEMLADFDLYKEAADGQE